MTNHERRYVDPIIRQELDRSDATCSCDGQHRHVSTCEMTRETDRARRLALLEHRDAYS